MTTPATAAQYLVLEVHEPLARITFTRPPLNVIDFQMMDELTDALKQIEQRREVSAVILSGGERAFSAGVDVAVHTPENIPAMLQKFHGLILAVTRLSKITIAEVHGACLGGGAELAMGCYPPLGCAALAALVGQKRAADLIFTGRTFSGKEAAEWGLANSAHSEGELKKAIEGTLDHLCKLSPAALAHAKKAFYAWDSVHLDKGLARAEKIYLEELMQTEDAKEGINAWLEKRKPEWKGK